MLYYILKKTKQKHKNKNLETYIAFKGIRNFKIKLKKMQISLAYNTLLHNVKHAYYIHKNQNTYIHT